jgi:hypothetical protein
MNRRVIYATRWNAMVSSSPSALATRSSVAKVGELLLGETGRLPLPTYLATNLVGPASLLVAGLRLWTVPTLRFEVLPRAVGHCTCSR